MINESTDFNKRESCALSEVGEENGGRIAAFEKLWSSKIWLKQGAGRSVVRLQAPVSFNSGYLHEEFR